MSYAKSMSRMSCTGNPFLSVSRLELLDAVLNLCAYHHPKDIILPAGYVIT